MFKDWHSLSFLLSFSFDTSIFPLFCVWLYVFSYQLLCSNKIWHQVNFKWQFSFLFSRPVTTPRLKSQADLLFISSWKENSWIHTFTKGISAMWNSNDLVQDLNLVHFVHYAMSTSKCHSLSFFSFLFFNFFPSNFYSLSAFFCLFK